MSLLPACVVAECQLSHRPETHGHAQVRGHVGSSVCCCNTTQAHISRTHRHMYIYIYIYIYQTVRGRRLNDERRGQTHLRTPRHSHLGLGAGAWSGCLPLYVGPPSPEDKRKTLSSHRGFPSRSTSNPVSISFRALTPPPFGRHSL